MFQASVTMPLRQQLTEDKSVNQITGQRSAETECNHDVYTKSNWNLSLGFSVIVNTVMVHIFTHGVNKNGKTSKNHAFWRAWWLKTDKGT